MAFLSDRCPAAGAALRLSATLCADARAAVGGQHGLLCQRRRVLPLQLLGGARLRQDSACRHLCARLPAHSRGPLVWPAPAAEEDWPGQAHPGLAQQVACYLITGLARFKNPSSVHQHASHHEFCQTASAFCCAFSSCVIEQASTGPFLKDMTSIESKRFVQDERTAKVLAAQVQAESPVKGCLTHLGIGNLQPGAWHQGHQLRGRRSEGDPCWTLCAGTRGQQTPAAARGKRFHRVQDCVTTSHAACRVCLSMSEATARQHGEQHPSTQTAAANCTSEGLTDLI